MELPDFQRCFRAGSHRGGSDYGVTEPRAEFTPVPFGPDRYAKFGDEYALPVVGNFDPPVTGEAVAARRRGNLHTNLDLPMDVNDDGYITPIDALIPINRLNSTGSGAVAWDRPRRSRTWTSTWTDSFRPSIR